MNQKIQRLLDFAGRYRRILFFLPSALLVVLLVLFWFSSSRKNTDQDFKKNIPVNFLVNGVTIPNDLNFAGDQVPLNDFAVREALEHELTDTYWQPQMILIFKRASRWFPVIEPILKKNNIPDDFKYIAVIESGLTPSRTAKTAGFWELLEPVAEYYHLRVDDNVDERLNLVLATDVACKIFKSAYEHYHNWTLAAASFDLGMGGIDEQLARQKSGSFYDLFLNEETGRYIYRILAVKEILSRPKDFGYTINPRQMYAPIPSVTVKTDSSIADLAAFAIAHKSTYRDLKLMNPWLLGASLENPDHKTYLILLPAKGVKLYGMDATDSTLQQRTQVLPDSVLQKEMYRVKAGDTWDSVAKFFNVDENLLLSANKRTKQDTLKEGENIFIPKK